jgi:protein O-mannosyl-transferase
VTQITSPSTLEVAGTDKQLDSTTNSVKTFNRKAVFALLAILIGTIGAFSPALFNFFAGDDFVHLTWLPQAVAQPELIWRNFHSSWLDGTTTRFYRPLISVFMVSDYLLYGLNGLGFHLTNLAFHVASSLLIYLIVFRLALSQTTRNSEASREWALLSSAMFALYPLHPEAVSWITGRVDTIVTTFCLANFWAYLRWRDTRNWLWLGLSVVFLGLGLLSKEMAITMPALLFAWELLPDSRRVPIKHRVIAAFKCSLPFWGLLVVYFMVRRAALGTFVGGYDDSLFFVANLKNFVLGWIHALRMTIVPINGDIMGSNNILSRLWIFTLAGCALCSVLALKLRRDWMAPATFVVLWLGLSLAPVYKIFSIADDLQGSRLAYVATVPLCILFGLALSVFMSVQNDRLKTTLRIFAAGTLCLTAILLWQNNRAWALAGHESNAIRSQLSQLYSDLPGDPQVVILGLPDNIKGAYVCRNALYGMVRKPQLHRDINNCLMLDKYDQILPFGLLRSSIQAAGDSVHIYRWDSASKRLVPVDLPQTSKTTSRQWEGQQLQALLEPVSTPGTSAVWEENTKSLAVTSGASRNNRAALNLTLDGEPAWNIDFVRVSLDVDAAGTGGVDLFYKNDFSPEKQLAHRAHCSIPADQKKVALVFALHNQSYWALGGECRGLELRLPESSRVRITKVELVRSPEMMPSLTFANSGFLGTKGFAHLSQEQPELKLALDTSKVPGASGAILEITRANVFFESQNSAEPSGVVMKRIPLNSTAGEISLRRADFGAVGLHEARARAMDSNGNPVGVAGDHFVISIDN